MKTPSAAGRLRLKITLDSLKPAVWRRVEVNDNLSFYQLHRVIQMAMGWEDCHMHEFEVDRRRVGEPGADDDIFSGGEAVLAERSTLLSTLLEGCPKFRYWYDFGDDWWHTIAVEKRLPADPESPPAQLVAGVIRKPARAKKAAPE